MNQKTTLRKVWNAAIRLISAHRPNQVRDRRGFTLAELLMVVVILGILSAVALPRFAPQKEKAYVAEAVGMLSAIRQAQEAFKLENGIYCTGIGSAFGGAVTTCTWGQLGLENPTVSGRPWSYTISGAAVTATRNANHGVATGDALENKTIILNYDGTYVGDHPNEPAN